MASERNLDWPKRMESLKFS